MTYSPDYVVAIKDEERSMYVGFSKDIVAAIKGNEEGYDKTRFSNQKTMAYYITKDKKYSQYTRICVSASLNTFNNITRSRGYRFGFERVERAKVVKKIPSNPNKILCYKCHGDGRIKDTGTWKTLNENRAPVSKRIQFIREIYKLENTKPEPTGGSGFILSIFI